MLSASDIIKSPAAPSAVLLYGIVFLFAIAYYVGTPWQRAYTIALYMGVSAWAVVVIFDQFKWRRPSPNQIDLLFAAFLASVLLSAAINWWEGTAEHFKLMPVFFLAPYVLGRAMLSEDCYLLRYILIGMGVLLLLPIFPAYLHVLKSGLPYVNTSLAPLLFGQGHGVMLSGLLLSVAFLGLVSVLLSQDGTHCPSFLTSAKGRYVAYALLILIVVTMGWISARGSALAGILGMAILFLMSPRSTRGRKLEILLVMALALTIVVVNALQWKSNSEFYAAVLQAPVTLDSAAGDTTGSARPAARKGPILGEAACTRIVDGVSDRWVHYQQAVALFLAKPLFGAGANHYGFHACTGPGSFPHSTLLQVLAELGVFVGAIYCALIWMTFRALLQSRQRSAGSPAEHVWIWFVAFSAMQVLIAQLNGNYFISAGLYFVMGVAASVLNQGTAAAEDH